MAEDDINSLALFKPDYDSPLTDILFELNHLRKLELNGSTMPWIFFQLKAVFHLFESVGSARIEGNRTTIAEYVEQKIDPEVSAEERFSEIANVEGAMRFIEENTEKGTVITHSFIQDLHALAVTGLDHEGDRTPGAYRNINVAIQASSHVPPDAITVRAYMDELLEFINHNDSEKYDLIKTAIAHHRFVWIHPFGNGNGRVVRLLTYALLIKYGFNVKEGKLLNPTAVFCNDRDVYYDMLSMADSGDVENWCIYVLGGVVEEISKINRLLDHDVLLGQVLLPTLKHAYERGVLNDNEFKALQYAAKEQVFRAADLELDITTRQRSVLIASLKEARFIKPLKEGGREYTVNFVNNPLMRSLVITLEGQGFIPPIG